MGLMRPVFSLPALVLLLLLPSEAFAAQGNQSDAAPGIACICLFLAITAGVVAGLSFYFLPTIIAFKRNHHYRWVIFAINLLIGYTGLGFLIALAWAVWPRKTSLLDPVIGDPTTADGSGVFQRYGAYGRAVQQGYANQPPAAPVSVAAPALSPGSHPATRTNPPTGKVCPNCGTSSGVKSNRCYRCGRQI